MLTYVFGFALMIPRLTFFGSFSFRCQDYLLGDYTGSAGWISSFPNIGVFALAGFAKALRPIPPSKTETRIPYIGCLRAKLEKDNDKRCMNAVYIKIWS